MNKAEEYTGRNHVLDNLFVKSLSYLEGLHGKLFSMRFSQSDFEQLNASFTFNNLEKNLELAHVFEKVESLSIHITQNLVDQVERVSSQLINDYMLHQQCVFLLDQVAHSHLSSAVKQALAVFHLLQNKKIDNHLFKNYPQLKGILSKEKPSTNMIDGWYFNDNFFTIDHDLFHYLGVELDIIRPTDKKFCVKSINFLEEVSRYTPGESINKIASDWKNTTKGNKRWQGTLLENIVEGEKAKSTHGFDWISENEVIYQKAYGVGLSGGSESFLFKKDELGNWQKVKRLQKLIR